MAIGLMAIVRPASLLAIRTAMLTRNAFSRILPILRTVLRGNLP